MNMSKRIFKPAITLFAMSVMLLFASLWPSAQVATGTSPESNAAALSQLKFPRIPISIRIGRAKEKCGRFGICKITIGIVSAADKARTVKAELSATDDGKLQLTLLERPPEEERTLFVDEEIPLSPEIARRLGVRGATIHEGEYAFSERKSVLNARLTR